MNKLTTLCAAIVLTSASTLALAGDHGIGPAGFDTTVTTVASLLDNGRDHQIVVLNGRLTNYLGRNRYEFQDETGTIDVFLDKDYDWSHISKDQLIQITGKYDDYFLDKKIYVKRAVPLEKAN